MIRADQRAGGRAHSAAMVRLLRTSSRIANRFGRSQSGASAIEFAILALPLLLLLAAILEVGLVYAATFSLENATAQGARVIRTGQAQNKGFDAGKFKTELCTHLSAPLSCTGVKLDVRKFSSFSGVDLTNPLDSKGALKQNFTYNPGVGGDVVVVRAFYEWTLAAKMPKDIALSNMGNGNRLLVATAAFRNEPFKTATK